MENVTCNVKKMKIIRNFETFTKNRDFEKITLKKEINGHYRLTNSDLRLVHVIRSYHYSFHVFLR